MLWVATLNRCTACTCFSRPAPFVSRPRAKRAILQGALHRFLQVSRAGPQSGGANTPHPDELAAEAMRCRLAEARVAWGKGETDGALRAARAVATRLLARVGQPAGDGGGAGGPSAGSRIQEEQRLLSEVCEIVVRFHFLIRVVTCVMCTSYKLMEKASFNAHLFDVVVLASVTCILFSTFRRRYA